MYTHWRKTINAHISLNYFERVKDFLSRLHNNVLEFPCKLALCFSALISNELQSSGLFVFTTRIIIDVEFNKTRIQVNEFLLSGVFLFFRFFLFDDCMAKYSCYFSKLYQQIPFVILWRKKLRKWFKIKRT